MASLWRAGKGHTHTLRESHTAPSQAPLGSLSLSLQLLRAVVVTPDTSAPAWLPSQDSASLCPVLLSQQGLSGPGADSWGPINPWKCPRNVTPCSAPVDSLVLAQRSGSTISEIFPDLNDPGTSKIPVCPVPAGRRQMGREQLGGGLRQNIRRQMLSSQRPPTFSEDGDIATPAFPARFWAIPAPARSVLAAQLVRRSKLRLKSAGYNQHSLPGAPTLCLAGGAAGEDWFWLHF